MNKSWRPLKNGDLQQASVLFERYQLRYAALLERNVGELKAETNFGQIYTNLDIKLSGSEFEDFHTVVSAKPGSGPRYSFESKYGNVYLRKQ
jgi:hypothetical protein